MTPYYSHAGIEIYHGDCMEILPQLPKADLIFTMIFAKPAWRLRDKGASGVGDVWYVPQESGTEHPAPFPIGLPLRAIETTKPGLVIDPFAGSGTTLRAAKDSGRAAIGIEINEQYCEIIAKRLSQEVMKFT